MKKRVETRKENNKTKPKKEYLDERPFLGGAHTLSSLSLFFVCVLFCLLHVGPVISNLDSTNNIRTHLLELSDIEKAPFLARFSCDSIAL